MAEPEIAVLLRTCKHENVGDSADEFGYALKCDNVSISYAKTPIQIPTPRNPPILFDIGVYRPSISLSGVIDTKPGNASGNNTTNFWDMESISFTRISGYGTQSDTAAKTYYIPYKNKLEDFIINEIYSATAPIELEVGDASYALSTASVISTGGGVYLCAVQQGRFQVDASKEDRYTFSLQFVVAGRQDS